jgi:Fe-S-cluster-containing hydrogenase component 2
VAKVLVISPEKCTGCRTCELACSFSKTKCFNPQNAAVTVFQYDEAAVSVPVTCLQCEDPSCMKVCTVGAITKDKDNKVLVNKNKCIGCKLCIVACPFGNMSYNSVEKTMVKCDLCDGNPKCAELCTSGAIQYKEATPGELNRKRRVADKLRALFEEVEE